MRKLINKILIGLGILGALSLQVFAVDLEVKQEADVSCRVLWQERIEYAEAIKEGRGQKDYNRKQLHLIIDKLLNRNCLCVVKRQYRK